MWTSLFWKDVAERVLATVAQVILGIITLDGFNIASLDFVAAATLVGVAALGVILKALIASRIGPTVSPASLAPDERGI